MSNKLPVYKMVLNEDNEGIYAIALVEYPAIERELVRFSQPHPVKFKIDDEEKRIASGALLLSNTPIYRREGDFEYYLTIEPEQVVKAVQKFFANGNQTQVNEEHTKKFFEGVTLFESLIIDSSRGIKCPEGYGDIPEGSWFGSFFVQNEEVWQAIKEGTFKGFSIEGWFHFDPVNLSKNKTPLQKLFQQIQEVRQLL